MRRRTGGEDPRPGVARTGFAFLEQKRHSGKAMDLCMREVLVSLWIGLRE
jgi:hypothetical protein